MYIKVDNEQVQIYPYVIGRLKLEHPTTSFPDTLSDELLAEYHIYKIKYIEQPNITYKQNIIEGIPEFIDGAWTQTWIVTDKEQEEIDRLNEQLRAEAYRNESDPLFFKWQRGEIEQQVWLDKVAEIKARYA